jgi:hypothetical protein
MATMRHIKTNENCIKCARLKGFGDFDRPAEFLVRGTVTVREITVAMCMLLCWRHAENFAVNHGLPMPEPTHAPDMKLISGVELYMLTR